MLTCRVSLPAGSSLKPTERELLKTPGGDGAADGELLQSAGCRCGCFLLRCRAQRRRFIDGGRLTRSSSCRSHFSLSENTVCFDSFSFSALFPSIFSSSHPIFLIFPSGCFDLPPVSVLGSQTWEGFEYFYFLRPPPPSCSKTNRSRGPPVSATLTRCTKLFNNAADTLQPAGCRRLCRR